MSKKFNTYEVGLPVSPASLVSKKIEKASKVTISAGGGIGGSLWNEYGEVKGDVANGGFIVIVDAITKEERTINTRFVVEVEEVQLLKVVSDTTSHANHYKTTCKKQTQTIYYWFPKTAKISVSNSYISNEKLEKNLIKRITEED